MADTEFNVEEFIAGLESEVMPSPSESFGDAGSMLDPSLGSEDNPFIEEEESDPSILQKQKAMQFDGPIPGQAMTKVRGQQAHQQPPQYTSLEDAAEFVLQGFLNPTVQRDVLSSLDKGVPAHMIVESMIMVGVSEGKWTIDLGMLMGDTIMTNIVGLSALSGVEINFGTKDVAGKQKTMKQWHKEKVDKKKGVADKKKLEEVQAASVAKSTTSLLSRSGDA
tara:strand:+ start:470 stop:1135 length:666 start_codon:yes stop_codon:yes gene_type:complete